MTPEENKAIVLRLFDEVINTHKFHLAEQFVTSDLKRFDLCRLFPDREGSNAVNEHMTTWTQGVPDLRVDPVQVIAGEDCVTLRYLAHGTHSGELLGRPGTGKSLRLEGVNVYRLVDGKIAETWQYLDGLSLLRQIGALPPEHT